MISDFINQVRELRIKGKNSDEIYSKELTLSNIDLKKILDSIKAELNSEDDELARQDLSSEMNKSLSVNLLESELNIVKLNEKFDLSKPALTRLFKAYIIKKIGLMVIDGKTKADIQKSIGLGAGTTINYFNIYKLIEITKGRSKFEKVENFQKQHERLFPFYYPELKEKYLAKHKLLNLDNLSKEIDLDKVHFKDSKEVKQQILKQIILLRQQGYSVLEIQRMTGVPAVKKLISDNSLMDLINGQIQGARLDEEITNRILPARKNENLQRMISREAFNTSFTAGEIFNIDNHVKKKGVSRKQAIERNLDTILGDIIRLTREGKDTKAISNMIGASITTVNRWKREYNIPNVVKLKNTEEYVNGLENKSKSNGQYINVKAIAKETGRQPAEIAVRYRNKLNEQVLNLIRENKNIKEMADICGVRKATIRNWIRNNESLSSEIRKVNGLSNKKYDNVAFNKILIASSNKSGLNFEKLIRKYKDAINLELLKGDRVTTNHLTLNGGKYIRPDLTIFNDNEVSTLIDVKTSIHALRSKDFMYVDKYFPKANLKIIIKNLSIDNEQNKKELNLKIKNYVVSNYSNDEFETKIKEILHKIEIVNSEQFSSWLDSANQKKFHNDLNELNNTSIPSNMNKYDAIHKVATYMTEDKIITDQIKSKHVNDEIDKIIDDLSKQDVYAAVNDKKIFNLILDKGFISSDEASKTLKISKTRTIPKLKRLEERGIIKSKLIGQTPFYYYNKQPRFKDIIPEIERKGLELMAKKGILDSKYTYDDLKEKFTTTYIHLNAKIAYLFTKFEKLSVEEVKIELAKLNTYGKTSIPAQLLKLQRLGFLNRKPINVGPGIGGRTFEYFLKQE
ncbi:MAG: winged helix-turn-helix transcriptional regulator [Candidatus Heimdallarchaeota archaeon]|nr:winged helix-turn-helix transcriptional regulator [Candidatus Heimdallarchaeota archaeon]